jgi:hypothetical protein
MVVSFAKRMLTEPDLRLLGKFAYNFGIKGALSVEKYKRRLKRGEHFPPFLFISVISGCQLRCQGCWVDVAEESKHISADDMNRLIGDAKKHGNSYFGILGGEPFLHPQLMDIFEAHPDCYFQVFTNGQLITDQVAGQLRRVLRERHVRGDRNVRGGVGGPGGCVRREVCDALRRRPGDVREADWPGAPGEAAGQRDDQGRVSRVANGERRIRATARRVGT